MRIMCVNMYVYMYSMYMYNNVYVSASVNACEYVYDVHIHNVHPTKSIYIQLYNRFARELFRRLSQMFLMN